MNGEGKDWRWNRRLGKTVDFTEGELRIVKFLEMQRKDEQLRALLNTMSTTPYTFFLDRVKDAMVIRPRVPYVIIPLPMLAELKRQEFVSRIKEKK